MAIFKCKMCGGDLEVLDGVTVCECEYCGTKQTVSATKDEVITNLYNRANNLRLKCEFDKAEAIYDKIVEKDDSESEAHWGIVLCKYGIEYVDDPATATKIPTCHRTLFEAIRTDADYQAAVDYADSMQQAIYEKEAIAIDKIQKNILEIVKNEKPFDVFICYKETDENGNRTIDSTIANDIYYQLTEAGFKVFYAAITLEEKLGQEYEPYIFAALNSSKVMLVLGTNPMYFNAVWVKNEWSRYLKLMKYDRDKLLIPCYRDMDAYELPEEFAHLQAQDMSKIGFINDVIRGIKKVLVKDDASVQTAPQVINSELGNNLTALMERGYMALEDSEWERADDFFEQVLNFDAKNADAYLGKLLAKIKAPTKEKIVDRGIDFSKDNIYQKIKRFGSNELVKEMESYLEKVIFVIQKGIAPKYEKSLAEYKNAETIEDYIKLCSDFSEYGNFKDSKELVIKCQEKIKYLKTNYGTVKVKLESNFNSTGSDSTVFIKVGGQRKAISGMKSGSVFEFQVGVGECKVSIGNQNCQGVDSLIFRLKRDANVTIGAKMTLFSYKLRIISQSDN